MCRLQLLFKFFITVLISSNFTIAQNANSSSTRAEDSGSNKQKNIYQHIYDYRDAQKAADNKSGSNYVTNSDYDKNVSLNYFHIDKSDESLWNGKHWDRKDYPLTVYIKKSYSKFYKPKFFDYISYAFRVWERADTRINFELTTSSSGADIIISFTDNLMKKYNKDYLGLTNYEMREDKKLIQSNVQISLLKFDGEPLSEGEVKTTIIHELGHALGLGHSDNKFDIMFPFIDPNSSSQMTFHELSVGDIEAVKSEVDLGFNDKN